LNTVENFTLAKYGAIGRMIGNISKLGGAAISAATDLGIYGSEMKDQGGKTLLGGIAEAFSALSRIKNTKQKKEIAEMLGLMLDGTIHDTAGRNQVGDNTFAEAGGGKVLQVVTAEDGTTRTTTSTSFVTGSNTLSVDITPSATSSKIYVICHTPVQNTGTGENAYYTIFRDSTNLGDSSSGLAVQMPNVYTNITMTFLDSPNSTSELTYQVYMRGTNGNTAKVSANGPHAVITAFEIGA
ncbi:hypothetical protein N8561_01390, partial [bacterium]|nr:hypothetical protein [bacterium]